MPQVYEFKLPDLGEGLTEAEIVRWLVAVGDVVAVDEPVVEVETAKAMVEVPCPYGGVVTARFGEEGTELPVGAPLLTVAVGSPGAEDIAQAGPTAQSAEPHGRRRVGERTRGVRNQRGGHRAEAPRTGEPRSGDGGGRCWAGGSCGGRGDRCSGACSCSRSWACSCYFAAGAAAGARARGRSAGVGRERSGRIDSPVRCRPGDRSAAG